MERRTLTSPQLRSRSALWAVGAGVWLACSLTWLSVAVSRVAAPQGVPTLQTIWRRPLSKLPAMAWRPRHKSKPLLVPSGLVVVGGRAGLAALRASDGSFRWRLATKDGVYASPVAAGDAVYAATVGGQLYAISSSTGKSHWPAIALGAEVRGPLALDQRHVYVSDVLGTTFAVDRAKGKVVWRRRASTTQEFLVTSNTGPLPMGDRLVVADVTGQVAALGSRDGVPIWTRRLVPQTAQFRDLNSAPVALGPQQVLVSGHLAGLIALRADSGVVLWRDAVDGVYQPVVNRGVIYAAVAGTELRAWTLKGRLLWRRKLISRPLGEVSVASGWLLVPSEVGLTAHRMRDGLPVRRWDDGFGFGGPLTVVGSSLFAISNAQVAYRWQLVADR